MVLIMNFRDRSRVVCFLATSNLFSLCSDHLIPKETREIAAEAKSSKKINVGNLLRSKGFRDLFDLFFHRLSNAFACRIVNPATALKIMTLRKAPLLFLLVGELFGDVSLESLEGKARF
jgi:hypothetical protein